MVAVQKVKVGIRVRSKYPSILIQALRPDEPESGFLVEGDELRMSGEFIRVPKARAWLEAESRLITTILKTLDQDLS